MMNRNEVASDSRAPAQPPQAETGGLYEKRVDIYAREVKGLFANWRWAFLWLTQTIFYGLCWLEWNGRQAVLFHLVERKFYLFGLVLWPQDVFYLAVLLIISACALFLFTAVAGRLFCGYACPQTVYTLLFMWIENRIEGDRPARIKLDKQPLARKLPVKTFKHLLWGLLSLWTGFTFVGYFTPIKELVDSAATLSFGPWEWFWILFYAAFTYFMAGFMREQMCKYVCPYARFQGVMFDPDTLIITYDPARGEPRAPRKKGAPSGSRVGGDCIDCGLCAQVCPTGIDIRDGLQIECIGCAACIDSCDQVMDKVGSPRGLIRYSTENALAKGYTKRDILAHIARPRVLIYSGVLVALTFAMFWSLYARVPLKVDVTRDRASLAREVDDGLVENVYQLHLVNTVEKDRRFKIAVAGLDTANIVSASEIDVPGISGRAAAIRVRAAPDAGKKGSNRIYFEIQALDDSAVAVREKATFLQP